MEFVQSKIDFEQLIGNIEHAPSFGNVFGRFTVQGTLPETFHDEFCCFFQRFSWNFTKKIFKVCMYLVMQCSKIEKKSAISKVKKPHYLHFQKRQKINFCTRKNFKTTKNAILGLFSDTKIDFLPFLKMQIMCFCTFEIALFSNFRALCAVPHKG